MTMRSAWTKVATAIMAVAVSAVAAEAKVVTTAHYPALFVVTTPGMAYIPTLINPKTKRNVYSKVFDVTTAGTYLLTYSVVCSASGNGVNPFEERSAFFGIDILVNDLASPAVRSDLDPFCTSDGDPYPISGAKRETLTIPVTLKAGRNSILLQGRLSSAATAVMFYNMSLTISD